MSFREEAIREYYEEVRRKEEAKAEARRKTIKLTKRALQTRLHVDESEMREIPEEGIVEVDGIPFTFQHGLQVVTKCSVCGANLYYPVFNRADVGRILSEEHVCLEHSVSDEHESTMQSIEEALQEIAVSLKELKVCVKRYCEKQ